MSRPVSRQSLRARAARGCVIGALLTVIGMSAIAPAFASGNSGKGGSGSPTTASSNSGKGGSGGGSGSGGSSGGGKGGGSDHPDSSVPGAPASPAPTAVQTVPTTAPTTAATTVPNVTPVTPPTTKPTPAPAAPPPPASGGGVPTVVSTPGAPTATTVPDQPKPSSSPAEVSRSTKCGKLTVGLEVKSDGTTIRLRTRIQPEDKRTWDATIVRERTIVWKGKVERGRLDRKFADLPGSEQLVVRMSNGAGSVCATSVRLPG